MLKKIKENLKNIKIKDILAIPIFIITILPALIFKLVNLIRKKQIWLIMESEETARDNGFVFYKYMKNNHPEINTYYVIDKMSKDYNKVKKYGNIIQYGSIKHWLFYLAANKNISSQKSGNPSYKFFYLIHVVLGLFNNRVFLQHGVIKDDLTWLYYKNTKFKVFICGAKDEYNYVSEKYGYPKGSVKYTGLARFDNLHDFEINNNKILIMPTWRDWLCKDRNILKNKDAFKETKYYKKWSLLLNDKELIKYIEKNNITLYFYPHYGMKNYINYFKISSKNIKIVKIDDIDIQKLLKECALMITDYSSVFMDFAYMRKPVIYYQFDKTEYRSKQYKEGYFSYENNGFGEVLENNDDVVKKIIKYAENNYDVEKKYMERMCSFFELYDQNNCDRIYNAIIEKDTEI